jgi:hypothetical protein
MNRVHCFHHIRRTAAVLAGFAASALVVLASATAAFAYVDPPPGSPAGPVSPPPQVHTIVTGGMPGWQIALIAIGAALFAAALAVIADRAYTAHRQVTAAQP